MSVKEGLGTPDQLDKEFDHYVNFKRKDAIDAAMSDNELRELVLSMALEKGLLNTLDFSSEVEAENEEPVANNPESRTTSSNSVVKQFYIMFLIPDGQCLSSIFCFSI